MHIHLAKIIMEINEVISDHTNASNKLEREAVQLLNRAKRDLALARAKFQEAEVRGSMAVNTNRFA